MGIAYGLEGAFQRTLGPVLPRLAQLRSKVAAAAYIFDL